MKWVLLLCCQDHCGVEEETWEKQLKAQQLRDNWERRRPTAAETDGEGMFFPLAPVDNAHFSSATGENPIHIHVERIT